MKKKKTKKYGTVKFNCMTCQQAGKTLVIFSSSAKQLWGITQVNEREEDDDKGYQRAASPARVAKIAQFIDAGNLIPNSVLISFRHAKLANNKKQLIVEKRKDAGWVIDGQHRLAGGNESKADIVLPVVAFTDLKLEDQISCFVTINKEQRGVSSSLYLELLKSLPGQRNANADSQERAVDLAHQLRQDEESPFFGRIVSTTSPKTRELSLTNFVRKIQPMLKLGAGRLTTYNDDERCKIINAYYKSLQQVFPAEYENANSVFFKTIGFGALMGVLPAAMDLTLNNCNGLRTAHFVKTFKDISDFDFSQWRGLSGSGAEITASDQLRGELLSHSRGSNKSTAIELDD